MFQQIVGYIVIAAILTIVLNIFSKIFASIKYFFQGKKIEQQLKKQAQEYINKKTEQEKDSSVRKFYGLFEFDFKDCPDEEGLKKDYCSMIDEKIRTKYRNSSLQLSATDKVFFNCSDFSKLDNIVDDFVKLYNFIVEINKKRHIKTNLLFSLWAKGGIISRQKAYKVLSEMNKLGFLNKVIANDEIYNQYQKQKSKLFDFHSHGIIKLMDSDEDFELYRLLKTSISKGDDE